MPTTLFLPHRLPESTKKAISSVLSLAGRRMGAASQFMRRDWWRSCATTATPVRC